MNVGGLARALRQLARAPARIAPAFASYVEGEMRKAYAAKQSPNGAAWAALKPATVRRKGSSDILIRGNSMLSGMTVRPLPGGGVAITLGASYARFHQSGTRHMVARKVLPEGSIPAAWIRKLERLTVAEFR